ncbi:MAG: hemin uptake protein HemP [Pirellulales bacterium]
MSDEKEASADESKAAAPPQALKLFRSEELFEGEKIVCIEHAGAIYRLQITARGKLILQK